MRILSLFLLLAPYALYFVLPNRFWFDIAIQIYINAIVAVGLNLLVGLAGQISLGHAGFFAVGAYAAVLLPTYLGMPTLLSVFCAIAIVGLLALAIGRPILRLRGHYLAMVTLAFGILIYIAINNTSKVTGGPDGITVPPLHVGDWKMPSAQLKSGIGTWYLLFYTILVAAILFAVSIERSAVGRALKAIGSSDVGARFCGLKVDRLKTFIFVVSAIYAGTAGVLSAYYSEFTAPDKADFMYSTLLITMIVLGGLGSTVGAVIGAFILTGLPQVLVVFHDFESAVLGLILIICMIFFRKGLYPTLTGYLRGRHVVR
jgi:branched-chain amino acid transport system permease protein